MTWVPGRKLWRKVYKGKVYTVSCKQLREAGHQPRDDTKDGSRVAANAWWAKKEFEVEAASRAAQRPPLPMQEVLQPGLPAGFYTDPQVALGAVPSDMLDRLEEDIHYIPVPRGGKGLPAIPRHPEGHDPATWTEDDRERLIRESHARAALAFLYNHLVQGLPLPAEVAARLMPAQVQAIGTLKGEPAAAPDKTVQAHAGLWLKSLQAKVSVGGMTATRCDCNRSCLRHFIGHLGGGTDITAVNAGAIQSFYNHCLSQLGMRLKDKAGEAGWSRAYARDVFATGRAFVRWLWEVGTIELPRNLNSHGFTFGNGGQKVRTWTVDDFKNVVRAAPGKLKLAVLLMANTGMTQVDVSDLLDSEVDWATGRVRRKRSKTRYEANVPEVEYVLWPLTFELLKKHRSGTERVLLTVQGKPYVREELKDGRLVKADGFRSHFRHLQKSLGITLTLKQLRKLGASLLTSHKDYGRLVPYFLGHAPRSMADKHYTVPPQALLDEAVTWLGRQLGQVT
jgi:integrase